MGGDGEWGFWMRGAKGESVVVVFGRPAVIGWKGGLEGRRWV